MGGEMELEGSDLSREASPLTRLKRDPGHRSCGRQTRDRDPDHRGPEGLGGRCNHYGADPEDDVFDGGLIHCPWHHASFDGATEKRRTHPPSGRSRHICPPNAEAGAHDWPRRIRESGSRR